MFGKIVLGASDIFALLLTASVKNKRTKRSLESIEQQRRENFV